MVSGTKINFEKNILKITGGGKKLMLKTLKVISSLYTLLVAVSMGFLVGTYYLGSTNGGANIGAGMAFLGGPILVVIAALLWLTYFHLKNHAAQLNGHNAKDSKTARTMRQIGWGLMGVSVVHLIYAYWKLNEHNPQPLVLEIWMAFAILIGIYWLAYHKVVKPE